MKLYLRLHIKPFQFVKDLLQVKAVFRQDENGFIDDGYAYFAFAVGLYIDFYFITGGGLVITELHRYIVRIFSRNLEGQIVRRHLTVGQNLVDQQA